MVQSFSYKDKTILTQTGCNQNTNENVMMLA